MGLGLGSGLALALGQGSRLGLGPGLGSELRARVRGTTNLPRHAAHAALSGTTQGAGSWEQAAAGAGRTKARQPGVARHGGSGAAGGGPGYGSASHGQPAVRTMMLATEGAAALGSVRDTSVVASPPCELRLIALCLRGVSAWVRVRGARLGRRTAAACSGWWWRSR